jgi:DNA-binding transcriptional MerR regulator
MGPKVLASKAMQLRSTHPEEVPNVRSNGQLLRFTQDGGDVSGIRTNAAAELLGVSPNTLRSWERRFGYPKPRRTQGGHRQYDLTELEALRRALQETHNISSAIEVARQRGEGPSSPLRLLDAFDHFDEATADRLMEESLAVRSVERSVEEVLLPAIEIAQGRDGREAEYELACRWATGWLHAARRVVPPASRPQGVLIFDSSERLDLEALHVQALELGLRRAGFRTLLLAFDLPPERVVRAMRALDPTAFVFCGGEATLDVVGRLVYTVRQVGSAAPVFEYRESMPVTGEHGIPSLGAAPSEAVERLKGYVDGGRIEQVVVVPEAQAEGRGGSGPVRFAAPR